MRRFYRNSFLSCVLIVITISLAAQDLIDGRQSSYFTFIYKLSNIFCKYLKRGVYHYAIELLPRYSGDYTLNPARVECMYFPRLYGSEQTRTIQIK